MLLNGLSRNHSLGFPENISPRWAGNLDYGGLNEGCDSRRRNENAARRESRPVPATMIAIGGKPILWPIMTQHPSYRNSQFAIAIGYKREAILRYFLDLYRHGSDLTVRTANGSVTGVGSLPIHRGRDDELGTGPMEGLVADRQLLPYRHGSFSNAGISREQQLLKELWTQGRAPWKTLE